ncbi:MAG: hypothetical protein KAR87_02535 [Candidatus Aenigmarchaeota archaeon]|nr:hypothetical protein [Candidatus Aenigmarchaeota archaeon]
MMIFQTRYNKLKKAIIKQLKGFKLWQRFKQNHNEIIAVFTIILVVITCYYAIQTHETVLLMEQNIHYTNKSVLLMEQNVELMKEDIRARNRPYLEIYNPTIKNNSDNTTCFIEVNVKNYGPIPAELVEKKFNFTIGEHNGSSYSNNPITIYTDKSFKFENKSFFTVEMCEIAKTMEAELKLKYKIHNTNTTFEAYSKVKCTQDDTEERRDCFTLKSYTT